MKQYLNLMTMSALSAMLMLTIACTNDDSSAEKPYVPEPVNFNIGLSGIEVTTRAQASGTQTELVKSVDNTFETNDLVAIYTTDGDGKKYTKVYKTGTWSTNKAPLTQNVAGATGVFYWKNTTEKKIYEAYSFGRDATDVPIANSQTDALEFAFSTGATSPEPFEVTTNQTEKGTFKDFLYNFGTVVYPDGTTNLADKEIQLNHQLAKIDVRVVTQKHVTTISAEAGNVAEKVLTIGKDAEAGGICIAGTFAKPVNFTGSVTPSVTAYTATINDDLTHGSGTWDANNFGTWTTVPGTSDANVKAITPRVISVEAAVSPATDPITYTTTYSAVIIPQTIAAGKTMFTVEYDGATYVYKPAANVEILTGKRYQYVITISASDLKVTNVAINNWVDSGGETDASAVLQPGS